MATIRKRDNSYSMRFYFKGDRRILSLDTRSKPVADRLGRRIERIIEFANADLSLDAESVNDLRNLSERIRRKLAGMGIVDWTHTAITLQDLVDYCNPKDSASIKGKANDKQHLQTELSLLTYFDPKTPLKNITEADCAKFKAWLLSEAKIQRYKTDGPGLASSTTSRRLKTCRLFFKKAVQKKWIESNPFLSVPVGETTNSDKHVFIELELSKRIIDAMPKLEHKVIFALARYAGMRTPSEPRNLRWSDLNFKTGWMHIRGQKTPARNCPIFNRDWFSDDLLPYLLEAKKQRDPDEKFVVPWLQTVGESAFDSVLRKTLKRLSIDPWPDLFRNFRRTAATEVIDDFGRKAESEWIGHGEDVSMRSYQMVTDEKVARATGKILTFRKRKKN